MSEAIIISLVSLAGTVLGSGMGIMTASKLVNYRLQQLENRVKEHNNLIDRMYRAEEDIKLLDQREKVTEHRLDDLEQ